MDPLDHVVILLYFGVLAAVVWWSTRRNEGSSADYFLAGRDVGWFAIGASIFASNIGSEHLVGLAGTGASDGVAMAHYELHAWCLLVLGWVMVPFYARSLVFTMPEFLERRYGPAARWFLAVVSLVSYVFTKIAVALFSAGVVFEVLFPDPVVAGVSNFWIGAIGVVVVTGAYTVVGGLRAVVYAEVVQTIVLLVGAALVLWLGLRELGGWTALREVSGPERFDLWKPIDDPKFPWLGMLLGAPLVGLWYWCTDQYIVQRTLAARGLTAARRGTIFGAYLKITPVFFFIIPGMVAFGLAKTGKLDPTILEAGHSNRAFPVMVRELLPVGIRGLVVAGLLAALMSSLASVFNSCSTLFTMDIYRKLRPQAPERRLVWVGRVATAGMVLLGLAWVPLISVMSSSLYEYLQSVQAYIAPPIFAVFFLGVFAPRINAAGCMGGLVGGFVMGMTRLALELGRKSGVIDDASVLAPVADLNFLYFCVLLFVASVTLIVVISLLTAPPPESSVDGLTYKTLDAEARREIRGSWTAADVVHSVVVVGLILAVYAYFTG